MLFLAIETSCDETAAAVFSDEPKDVVFAVALEDNHGAYGRLMVRAKDGAAKLHPRARSAEIGEMRRPVLLALVLAVRPIDAVGDEEHAEVLLLCWS